VDSQSETINSMLQILSVKYKNVTELSQKIREKDSHNKELMNKNLVLLKELTDRNNIIFLIIIAFLISTGFILYPVLIRKTHKISGPIYIMSKYMREVINGGFPELRPLRKKDELKEFYELFSQMMRFVIKKKK
jgi:nitrogen fixation/metabolism regulation signal transduction histidine kinase